MHSETTLLRRACRCSAGGVAGCARERRAYRCSRLLAGALLIVGVLTLVVPTAPTVWATGAQTAPEDPVYLLNAMYSLEDYNTNHAKALWLGIDSALHAAGYTAARGRPIKIIEPDPMDDLSDIVGVVMKALSRYPTLLGVIGPYSDARLYTVMLSRQIENSGLMFLSPFTGSSVVRTWTNNVYFMRAEPRLEMMTMVKHIANTLRVRRTAFMYLKDALFGEREYGMLVSVLSTFSLYPPALYAAPYSTTNTDVNTAAFDAMADTRPQVVIVWGMPGEQVVKFLQAVLTDPRTSSAYIISCFALQRTVFQVYYDLAMDGKLTPVDGQILSSTNTLPVTQVGTHHMSLFRAEMADYMLKTGRVDASLWADEAEAVRKYGWKGRDAAPLDSAAAAGTFFEEHPSTGQLMVTGWIAGSVIAKTLRRSSYIANRTAYRNNLFSQQRYIIGDDFVLGDYGGPCTYTAQFLGAVCYCNQGGRSAVLSSLDKAVWKVISDSGVSFTQKHCYSEGATLPEPLHFITLVYTDAPQLVRVAQSMREAALRFAKVRNIQRTVTVNVVEGTEGTVQTSLNGNLLNYTVDVLSGTLVKGVDVEGYLVPSPLHSRPHLVESKRNYVYLMPTLEQQMFVLYAKLSTVRSVTSIGSAVHAILHGYTSDEVQNITAVLYKSAATFNYDNPTVSVVPSTETIRSAFIRRQINFVLAVTEEDVADIADFLISDTYAIVVIVFDDLVIQYHTLVTALKSTPASVQARVITFTNLPLWSDTSKSAEVEHPLLRDFHTALQDPATYTPSSLNAVVVLKFMLEVVSMTPHVTSTALQQTIYANAAIAIDRMSFGTFHWDCTTTPTEPICVYKNYGAQDIVMLSVQRMLDPTVPPLSSPMTPTMQYRPRQKSNLLTAAQRNGLSAGAIGGGLVLICTCMVIMYCCIDSRNNDAAPKDGDEPVTLIFTDIESSTALWAALPQLMAGAIAAHHRAIRQLVRKYGCYEVKTIGDSFMIACKNAHSAVCLACEIQTKLLKHDWGTDAIDTAYREFELARVDTVEDYKPPTARLSKKEYGALWRGLRVRIGIHTGLTDIRYDEVTKGYDYYGDTSNMAARTEAVANGGQVIATEATWWALSNGERASIAHTAMGPQGLRGVPFAVEMFQLNAVRGRRHAALRTEIEAILPDEMATETASSAAGALLSSVGTVNGPAAGIAFVLSSCFAPYPVAQRVRELQPLLSKWSVGAPPRSRLVSEEDYCQGLMNRLAVRIATVTQARLRLMHEDAAEAVSKLPTCYMRNPLLREGDAVVGGVRRSIQGSSGAALSMSGGCVMRECRVRARLIGDAVADSGTCGTEPESIGRIRLTDLQHAEFPFHVPSRAESPGEKSATDDDEIVVVRVSRHPHFARPVME